MDSIGNLDCSTLLYLPDHHGVKRLEFYFPIIPLSPANFKWGYQGHNRQIQGDRFWNLGFAFFNNIIPTEMIPLQICSQQKKTKRNKSKSKSKSKKEKMVPKSQSLSLFIDQFGLPPPELPWLHENAFIFATALNSVAKPISQRNPDWFWKWQFLFRCPKSDSWGDFSQTKLSSISSNTWRALTWLNRYIICFLFHVHLDSWALMWVFSLFFLFPLFTCSVPGGSLCLGFPFFFYRVAFVFLNRFLSLLIWFDWRGRGGLSVYSLWMWGVLGYLETGTIQDQCLSTLWWRLLLFPSRIHHPIWTLRSVSLLRLMWFGNGDYQKFHMTWLECYSLVLLFCVCT